MITEKDIDELFTWMHKHYTFEERGCATPKFWYGILPQYVPMKLQLRAGCTRLLRAKAMKVPGFQRVPSVYMFANLCQIRKPKEPEK